MRTENPHVEIARLENQIAGETKILSDRESALVNQLCSADWGNWQWVRDRSAELAGIRALRSLLPARHEPLRIRIFELQRQIDR
jgi:hypothetical protein